MFNEIALETLAPKSFTLEETAAPSGRREYVSEEQQEQTKPQLALGLPPDVVQSPAGLDEATQPQLASWQALPMHRGGRGTRG